MGRSETSVCPICGRVIVVDEAGHRVLHAAKRFMSTICPGSARPVGANREHTPRGQSVSTHKEGGKSNE